MQTNLTKEPAALGLDTLERKFQEWREIVISSTGIVESLEIRSFLLVVVVRHRDEQRVT